MSASLLRKSLELVNTEYVCDFSGDYRIHFVKHAYVLRNKAEIGTKKETRIKIVKGTRKSKVQRGAADVQRKNITSVEQAKKQLRKKKAKALSNLRKLEKLRQPVVDEKLAKLILENIKKPGDKDQEVIFLKEEPRTAFTEEDFARFEAEYVDED